MRLLQSLSILSQISSLFGLIRGFSSSQSPSIKVKVRSGTGFWICLSWNYLDQYQYNSHNNQENWCIITINITVTIVANTITNPIEKYWVRIVAISQNIETIDRITTIKKPMKMTQIHRDQNLDTTDHHRSLDHWLSNHNHYRYRHRSLP